MEYPEISWYAQKTVVPNFNAIDNNKSLTYDVKTMSKVFKDFFLNLAESFLARLFLYYSNLAIPEVFHIESSSEEKVFKIMEKIGISKAAGIDKLSGRFLKDGAEILSKPISEICNLSISRYFLMLAILQNSNLFSRKAKKSSHLITGLSRLISKIIEKVVHDQTIEFLSGN